VVATTQDDSMNDLFAAAAGARANAHAPYSSFPVGAALRAASGRIYAGCNVENAAFPQGQCAEASAIGAMVTAGEREIVAIAVVGGGDGLCTPCGGCRQRLAEFARPDTKLHLCDDDGIVETVTMGEMLPFGFQGEMLK
jgi:cytidine deaminase